MNAMNSDREDDRLHRAAELGLRDADHEREQAPGRHVVGRRAAQGDDAEFGVLHLPVGEDPREHREGRDRHRHAHEQREAGERHVRRREVRIEPQREHRAEQERRDDAGVRNGDRGVGPRLAAAPR